MPWCVAEPPRPVHCDLDTARELVGDNGEAIAGFMYELMTDGTARDADRIEAAKWLGDRAFGRSVLPVDLGINEHPALDIRMFSTPDLKALLALLERYPVDVVEISESGQIEIGRGAS